MSVKLRKPEYPKDAWLRCCQECGHVQDERYPPVYGIEPSNNYKDRKCRKCKSESMDYGTQNEYFEEDEE